MQYTGPTLWTTVHGATVHFHQTLNGETSQSTLSRSSLFGAEAMEWIHSWARFLKNGKHLFLKNYTYENIFNLLSKMMLTGWFQNLCQTVLHSAHEGHGSGSDLDGHMWSDPKNWKAHP